MHSTCARGKLCRYAPRSKQSVRPQTCWLIIIIYFKNVMLFWKLSEGNHSVDCLWMFCNVLFHCCFCWAIELFDLLINVDSGVYNFWEVNFSNATADYFLVYKIDIKRELKEAEVQCLRCLRWTEISNTLSKSWGVIIAFSHLFGLKRVEINITALGTCCLAKAIVNITDKN